jgi:predicted phosphodiesterase
MKIAVLADIHGNFDALQAVLKDCAGEGVENIISLGDNIGYGPEPEKVIHALAEHRVLSVLGNHEYAVVDSGCLNRLNSTAKTSLAINLSRMSPEDKEYCAVLPFFLIRHDARFVHGCPPKSLTAYLFDIEPHKAAIIFHSFVEQIAFYGHTHDCAFFDYDGKRGARTEVAMGEYVLAPEKRYLINPGSVGQPRDAINKKAKYIIWDLDRGTVCFKAVAYDIKAAVAKIKALGLPDFNWERLMLKYA